MFRDELIDQVARAAAVAAARLGFEGALPGNARLTLLDADLRPLLRVDVRTVEEFEWAYERLRLRLRQPGAPL